MGTERWKIEKELELQASQWDGDAAPVIVHISLFLYLCAFHTLKTRVAVSSEILVPIY
jgi:hypothetical protein